MFQKTKVCRGLMLAFGGGLALGSLPALAQDQAPQRVEITGSSIKRIEGETALPVQIITRKDIEKSGAVNVEQLMLQVSAAASSGALTASSASGATTGGISAISLRGLTSIRTLVLLNGRRIAPYGIGFTGDSVSVDVNSIPLAAIERVEVLKDGASAIYGSDAIAGVVNFILRKDYQGTEVSALYGDTSGGGASTTRASAVLGFGDLGTDRYNVMFVASAQRETALFGRNRDFARSAINVETLNDTTSGNTFPANVFILNGPDAGKTRNPGAPSCVAPYAILDPLFPSTRCRFDPSPLVTLLPKSDRVSLFASAKFALTSSLEAFVEASYNKNRQNTVIQPVPLSDQFALPPSHPLFNVAPYNGFYPNDPARFGALAGTQIDPTGNLGIGAGFSTIVMSPVDPAYPTAYMQGVVGAGNPLPNIAVRYRSAVTGNRDLTDISTAPRLTFGLRGEVAGWDFDGAFLHTQSKVREQVNGGYPSQSAILPLLNSGTVNLWGPNSDAINAALQATNFTGDAFHIQSTIDSVGGKVSREILQMPAGPLAVAVGAEARKEKYLFAPSPIIQTGDISGYGGNFLTTDKSRNVEATFGEINVPIVKGLEADAAVRFDHYQGVGNSTTPKLGLKWQAAQQVLFRGSIGKGFRAPSLQDLYLPQTTGVTTQGLTDPLRCPTTGSSNDCQTQFPVTFGGNPALKPEKSTNATLGVVLEPSANFNIAIDAFKVDLNNTIVNGVTPTIILGDLTKYGFLVTRGPSVGGLPGPIINISQTNLNLGKTNVAGVDLDTRLSVPAGDLGKFTASLVGTYFIKYDTTNPDGSVSGGVGLINTSTGGIIPRWKHHLAIDWARGPWTWTVAQNWQASYWDVPGTFEDTDPTTNPGFHVRRVGAYETYDLAVTYTGIKDLKLLGGITNVFNRAPPYTNTGGQTSFQAGYDPQYADPRGRFVFVGVTYAFK
jgi:iron complex outermembrane receptor protein